MMKNCNFPSFFSAFYKKEEEGDYCQVEVDFGTGIPDPPR